MENLLRKRLEAIKQRAKSLREGYLARRGSEEPSDDGVFSFDLPGPPQAVEVVAPGRVIDRGEGAFYLVRCEGDAIAEDAGDVAARLVRLAVRPSWPYNVLDVDIYAGSRAPLEPDRVCFFDIETTGLVPNTYVFECGLMVIDGGRFVIEQLLARDYSEEGAMLAYLNEVLARHAAVVTYNGATFDLPFVRTRMAVNRVGAMASSGHLDLLWPARRHFSGILPNCKLVTIERHLRGTSRTGDIPGRYIPEAYHRFVDTGDARLIGRVLYHNRMDLLAMACLLNHLTEVRPPRRSDSAPARLF